MMTPFHRAIGPLLVVLLLVCFTGCRASGGGVISGQAIERQGDEIMIAGRLIHTGAPVVLWLDPGGYDAYRVDAHFAPPGERGWDEIKDRIDLPQRYNDRPGKPAQGWTPETLAGVVDQFVLHYDVCGVSSRCFEILHDRRGLSVHFMLDIDGTIYQTLDVKERAWHATKANGRSVGIEIANIGAYPPGNRTLDTWYTRDTGGVRISLPETLGDGGVRTRGYVGRPARADRSAATINGSLIEMHDLTREQYVSLVKLAAAINASLPGVKLVAPRTPTGDIEPDVLVDERFESFRGVLGHWHVQRNKIDPGPGLDWDLVLGGAKAIRQAGGNPSAGERFVDRALANAPR